MPPPWLSPLLGWTSTALWSSSFYPQLHLNHIRHSTSGLSFDFQILNLFGFLSYTLYTAGFLFSSTVRDEWEKRNEESAGEMSVRWNDFAFALHAASCCAVIVGQSLWYSRTSSCSSNRSSKSEKPVLSLWNQITLSLFFLALFLHTTLTTTNPLDLLYTLGYFKIYTALSKYTSQVYANYEAGSTIGWSHVNVLLDLTGGILSLGQLWLDGGGWEGVKGNGVKFGLGIGTLGFDAVFLLQHFVWYRGSERKEVDSAVEGSPLLG